MTDFVGFARAHGLNLDYPKNSGKIERCGTVDHPRKKNGAYLFDGVKGWVQNFETGGDLVWWNSDIEPTEDQRRKWELQRAARQKERDNLAARAADIAARLIKASAAKTHDYYHRKGIPDAVGLVVQGGKYDGSLFVPMYGLGRALVGGQVILWDSERWQKKMIYGTRAAGATYEIGTGQVVLCEGYATGLTIASVAGRMGYQLRVVVAFSAHNMVEVASRYRKAWVFADNDESGTGEACARKTGHPWVMSPTIGEDANDMLCHGKRIQLMQLIRQGVSLAL